MFAEAQLSDCKDIRELDAREHGEIRQRESATFDGGAVYGSLSVWNGAPEIIMLPGCLADAVARKGHDDQVGYDEARRGN